MERICIRLAEVPVGIQPLHPYIREFCRDYLTEEDPEFTVTMTEEDIRNEQSISEKENPGVRFPEPYLETLAVYRRIAEKMPEKNALLFHGSAVAVSEEAYLFTAPSGTGKTTHTRLWLERIPGSYVVNGDKPLLRYMKGRIYVCGTPWQGKENYGINRKVPLKAICILERNPENQIREVSLREVLPVLFQQTYHPEDAAAMIRTMELIGRMGESCRFYRLGCNMESDAARVSYEGMK